MAAGRGLLLLAVLAAPVRMGRANSTTTGQYWGSPGTGCKIARNPRRVNPERVLFERDRKIVKYRFCILY